MQYRFEPVAYGPLKVYKEPEGGEKYTVGIDTATGLGADYTCMQVLSNRLPFDQVAVFRAKWSVVDAALFANQLGHWYNDALIVVETNYPGNAVQDALIQTYRYPRNYQAEQHLDESPNVSSKYGFTTTQGSKWLLIREMIQAIKDEDIILNDPLTVEEMGSYVYLEDKTKTGAAPGLNDDTVIAIMLAYHGAYLYPQKPKARPKSPVFGNLQHKKMLDDFMKSIRNYNPGKGNAL